MWQGGKGYADPHMKMVVLPATDDAEATLHALEDKAVDGFGHTPCLEVEAGGTITPKEHFCYNLHFDTQVWQTLFKINATGASHLAIFAEHFPTEFERDAHYLKDDHGYDIEPSHEIPEGKAEAKASFDKPWGEAIGASILVMVCTLIGVIFARYPLNKIAQNHQGLMLGMTNAFAGGALLAAAFYLMLYEATHLIVRDEESFATAEWGSMILTGFITASVLDLFVNFLIGKLPGGSSLAPSQLADEAAKSPPPSPPPAEGLPVVDAVEGVDPSRRVRVLCGVLLGDFVHNLVDGLVIGTAFGDKHCYQTMAWTITAATIYHELAQEISDYFVLTNPNQGNLKPPVALLLNFLSGFSVLLGVCITMATEASMYSQGMMLAFGGGVYIQIGATECMPRVYEYAKTTRLRLLALAFFVVGALAIGLVLLDHEHCAVGGGGDDGAADPHAGHNHGRL